MNRAIDKASFFKPETLVDPFDFYRTAHREAPILPVPEQNMHIVFSYDLVAEATGRVEDFSNDFAALLSGTRAEDPEIKAITDQGWPGVSTLLTADPPVHTRFRKLVNLAFSMPRVNAIEADIRAKAINLIDGFAAKGECEFLEEFAIPLPVSMIAKQIGLEDQLDRVKRWSDSGVDQLSQMISKERELAPGQFSFQDMRDIYHFEQINRQTEVFAVLGDPVGHSLSPLLHNAAMRKIGYHGSDPIKFSDFSQHDAFRTRWPNSVV